MSEQAQTPLPDLLDRVPEDTVLGIHGEGPFPSYTNIPIGKLAHQAAAELRRLHATLAAPQSDALDAARFRWYFSDKPKGGFLMAYLEGMRIGWTTDQWRTAIDAAMRGKDQGND